jgi:hypothetical protein
VVYGGSGGSVDTVVELVTTTVVVTADVVGSADEVAVGSTDVVEVDEAEVEDVDEVNVVTADVTGIVVVSEDVAEEVTLVLEDVSLVTEDDSDVELVEIVDGTDVVDDDWSVVSADAEEDEVTVESVEIGTAEVVDVADVDSVETVGSGDVVEESGDVVDDEESVRVELPVWKTLAALAVEPLNTKPNTAREMITNTATRRLGDTPSRLLFIHPFFLHCMHLTMSCSSRINEMDESSSKVPQGTHHEEFSEHHRAQSRLSLCSTFVKIVLARSEAHLKCRLSQVHVVRGTLLFRLVIRSSQRSLISSGIDF